MGGNTTVLVDEFKDEDHVTRILATIWVERDSQKAIVIGAGGEQLKRISSAARKDMERLFGGKVYLGVWVKVRRDWTGDRTCFNSSPRSGLPSRRQWRQKRKVRWATR